MFDLSHYPESTAEAFYLELQKIAASDDTATRILNLNKGPFDKKFGDRKVDPPRGVYNVQSGKMEKDPRVPDSPEPGRQLVKRPKPEQMPGGGRSSRWRWKGETGRWRRVPGALAWGVPLAVGATTAGLHRALIGGNEPRKPKGAGKKVRMQRRSMKKAAGSSGRPGLWANIHAKRRRGEKMRKPGSPGAPTDKAIRDSQKTASLQKVAKLPRYLRDIASGRRTGRLMPGRTDVWDNPLVHQRIQVHRRGREAAEQIGRRRAFRERMKQNPVAARRDAVALNRVLTGSRRRSAALIERGRAQKETLRQFEDVLVNKPREAQLAREARQGRIAARIRRRREGQSKLGSDAARESRKRGMEKSAAVSKAMLRRYGYLMDDVETSDDLAQVGDLSAAERRAWKRLRPMAVKHHASLLKKAESIQYRGATFPGYNKPIKSNRKGKKKMVLVRKGGRTKLVHFGHASYEDYTQHKDKKRRENYLRRSAGIKGKGGRLTKDDPFSPNYWARRELW